MYRNVIKSMIDFVVSILLILILSPVFLILIICLSMVNQGKPFFFQTRPGKNENLFKIVKFKTMNDKRDVKGDLLPDHSRLTKIGAFVRKTSLDELPQLLNVIKGDMSLIGPRPLLPDYLPLYNTEQKRRHKCKPGITGWAQVNGRNAISWEQKFEFDVWYVNHVSFLLDFKIFLLTIKKVVKHEGISAEGHETMPTFIDYIKNKKD